MANAHDPNDPANSKLYYVGKPCIEKGCGNPAGTAWSELWCWECNAKRLDRVTSSLESIVKDGSK